MAGKTSSELPRIASHPFTESPLPTTQPRAHPTKPSAAVSEASVPSRGAVALQVTEHPETHLNTVSRIKSAAGRFIKL